MRLESKVVTLQEVPVILDLQARATAVALHKVVSLSLRSVLRTLILYRICPWQGRSR